jgi:hypothetical protein
MADIEQRKHRAFVSILSAIALAVSASQEVEYAKAHRIFMPPTGWQSPPPVHAAAATQSPPAPRMPVQAVAQPNESIIPPPAMQMEPEPTLQPAQLFITKVVSEGAPIRRRDDAVDVERHEWAANEEDRLAARRDTGASNMIASAQEPPQRPPEKSSEERQREATEAMEREMADLSRQDTPAGQVDSTDVPRPRNEHDETAASPVGSSAKSDPQTSHHDFITPLFKAAFTPVKLVLRPFQAPLVPETPQEKEYYHGGQSSYGGTPARENRSPTNAASSYHPSSRTSDSHPSNPAPKKK